MSVNRNDYVSEELSDCCGTPIYEDMGICSQCKEHCDVRENDEDE